MVLAPAAAEARGAETGLIGGEILASLPLFVPPAPVRSAQEIAFLDTVRRADGLILASPGYHGGVSGLVKNALDLLEETAADVRVYLTGVPVGLIATAYGWQATGSTIAGLRAIVHALRGWPTPLAAAVNSLTARSALTAPAPIPRSAPSWPRCRPRWPTSSRHGLTPDPNDPG